MDQKPSIGRIVHYRPEDPAAEVLPAVITKAWSDSCVNLEVFGIEKPAARFPTSVTLSETSPRSWRWPPRV